jgi:hypothetical protein
MVHWAPLFFTSARSLASMLKAREMGVRLPSLGPWLEQRA